MVPGRYESLGWATGQSKAWQAHASQQELAQKLDDDPAPRRTLARPQSAPSLRNAPTLGESATPERPANQRTEVQRPGTANAATRRATQLSRAPSAQQLDPPPPPPEQQRPAPSLPSSASTVMRPQLLAVAGPASAPALLAAEAAVAAVSSSQSSKPKHRPPLFHRPAPLPSYDPRGDPFIRPGQRLSAASSSAMHPLADHLRPPGASSAEPPPPRSIQSTRPFFRAADDGRGGGGIKVNVREMLMLRKQADAGRSRPPAHITNPPPRRPKDKLPGTTRAQMEVLSASLDYKEVIARATRESHRGSRFVLIENNPLIEAASLPTDFPRTPARMEVDGCEGAVGDEVDEEAEAEADWVATRTKYAPPTKWAAALDDYYDEQSLGQRSAPPSDLLERRLERFSCASAANAADEGCGTTDAFRSTDDAAAEAAERVDLSGLPSFTFGELRMLRRCFGHSREGAADYGGVASAAAVREALRRVWPQLSARQLASLVDQMAGSMPGGGSDGGRETDLDGEGVPEASLTYRCVLDFLARHCQKLAIAIDERTAPLCNTFAEPPDTAPPAWYTLHAAPLSQILELPATARCNRHKLLTHSSDGVIGLWSSSSLRPSTTFSVRRHGQVDGVGMWNANEDMLNVARRPLCAAYVAQHELAVLGCVDRHLYLYDCEHIDGTGERCAHRV